MQLKQNKAKNSTRKAITKKTIKKRTATRKNTPLVLNTENKLLHDILNQINVNNKQLSTILKILVPLDYPYEDSPNNSKNGVVSYAGTPGYTYNNWKTLQTNIQAASSKETLAPTGIL